MNARFFSADQGKFSGGKRQPVSLSRWRRCSAPNPSTGKKC
jgi:hypothetical protein